MVGACAEQRTADDDDDYAVDTNDCDDVSYNGDDVGDADAHNASAT